MLTIIISVVVFTSIAALTVKKFFILDKWLYIIYFTVIGLVVGAIVVSFLPPVYKISEFDVYYILDTPVNIKSSSDEISFFTKGDHGEIIPMNLKVDAVSVKHTNDKLSQIEVIKYVRTNKFSFGGPMVVVNVLIANPHHWCGFFWF